MAQAHIIFLVVIIFIIDFADNLFHDILQGDNATGSAKLINDYGDMNLVVLKLTQQCIQTLGFRNKIRRSDQALPSEVVRLADVWKQVFDIQHATNIVGIRFEHRNTAVVIVNDTFQHILKGSIDVEVNDILTAGHHILWSLITKTDDTPQHALLVFDVFLVGEFEGLLQVVNTQCPVVVLAYKPFSEHTTLEQNGA